jgi:hypothetical protein
MTKMAKKGFSLRKTQIEAFLGSPAPELYRLVFKPKKRTKLLGLSGLGKR